ncbi:MAG: 16S rRNA (guanine(527)-N(7))-methyltransferase RsmG [Clostridia bacterium]|nr:16S rRNA (guanine(527)-N(7))-methyltransferase RsmG [Clostridia bacterium]
MSVIDILKQHSPVKLSEEMLGRLDIIAERLKSENKKYNLTALTEDEDIALLHFADCLQLFNAYDFAGKRVIDVGCGGGFPSLVLAAEGSAHVTALDSTAKKLAFVAETAALAGIDNLTTLCGRAEEAVKERRESFDVAVSRGVSRLNALCELCLPYVKVGGTFIAMKGAAGAEEAEQAKGAIRTLGGALVDIISAPVPVKGDGHCLVMIKKVSPTPQKYPRPWAKIKSSPIA